MKFRYLSMLLVLSVTSAVTGATQGAGAEDAPSVHSDGSSAFVSGYRAGGVVHTGIVDSTGAARTDCRDVLSQDGFTAEAEIAAHTDWPLPDLSRMPLARYWIRCYGPGGTLLTDINAGVGYLYADQIVDFDAIARTLAQRYAAEHLGPSVAVGSSPPVGLVGVEQWFWVEGYDGEPVDEAHDVFGHQVRLLLRVDQVRWSFGDGTEASFSGAAGLGVKGDRSAIAHRYQRRSTAPADPTGSVSVSVTVEVAVSYTLDGAGPYPVNPPLQSSVTAALIVREAQAVVHPVPLR